MTKKVVPLPIPNNKKYFCTLVIVIFLLMVFVYYLWQRVSSLENYKQKQNMFNPKRRSTPLYQEEISDIGRCNGPAGLNGDPLTNPYVPPIRCDAGGLINSPIMMSIPGNSIPINIRTQRYDPKYIQVGIITKEFSHKNNEILPLMGRRVITSRDKWQYYSVSGGGAGGNLQTKLPVKIKGKNCSGEYGCDEIMNGDEVFVEGYRDNFRATIYENGLFSYIP